MKYLRENWYMGSTSPMLATTKYMTEPRSATERYFSRASEIFSSVCSASVSRCVMMPDVTCTNGSNVNTAEQSLISRMAPVGVKHRVNLLRVFDPVDHKSRQSPRQATGINPHFCWVFFNLIIMVYNIFQTKTTHIYAPCTKTHAT